MIVIIRMLTDDASKNLWDEIAHRKEDLQKVLQDRGRLLYLSKRKGHNEASLFVHAKDSNVINELITGHLSKVKSVSAIWVIHLFKPSLPEGIKKVYYAFTFHLYDETLQYSLLVNSEETLKKYLAEKVNSIEGVLKTEIHPIEKTKPFISYKEWQEYAGDNNTIPTWQQHMVSQFEE